MEDKKVYLCVHGHFYQPPRENPWLETIEIQESAFPYHDWNERVTAECYTPNAVSKIVDYKNRILDIVNNYSLISFNIGPTLMSWLEQNAPYTYERIIKADFDSANEHNGHGNAIAQVYNHMIMPLANERDKYTQVIWGMKDFQYRFGRKPEGIWLAETAVDDATLDVLIDCGIKFTVLSPYQAQRVRKIGDTDWTDVSWGSVDPGQAYKYVSKTNPKKSIALFFYDGSISKAVAFDELLKDGNKFIMRLKDGISDVRPYNQLVNIATDGESYGHHTKFGDMALSYVMKIRTKDENFIVTNFASYLASEPINFEAEIKPVSSWSCMHGVGRWCCDCGCSTGGNPGWNQKWRAPLREALDFLRDKITNIYKNEASKYFDDIEEARNNYISVILDRNERTISKFIKDNANKKLSPDEIVKVMKLMEMQRHAMLMYTSCGWFFSEISGLETTQIMKYAARAMQLANEFTREDLETPFLDILANAQSNIKDFGTGKDVYERFIKPSVVTTRQIAALWAISSLFYDFQQEESIYCYEIKQRSYHKYSNGNNAFVVGQIEVKSNITLEKYDLVIAVLQYADGDFHCTMRDYNSSLDYNNLVKDLYDTYSNSTLTEVIRKLDDIFGHEYYTIKDIPLEERRKILNILLKDKLYKFSKEYQQVYREGKNTIRQFQKLGLEVPEEFKLAAQYTLSNEFNKLFAEDVDLEDESVIEKAKDINKEATKFVLKLDKSKTSASFSKKVLKLMYKFIRLRDIQTLDTLLSIFDYTKQLDIELNISEAQNIYYNKVFVEFLNIIKNTITSSESKKEAREILTKLLDLGTKLNINTEYYGAEVLKQTVED